MPAPHYCLENAAVNCADNETAYNVNSLGDTRFRRLLGRENWQSLPTAVRERFSKRLLHGQSTVYRGYAVSTLHSPAGWLLSHLLRPFGAPLPLPCVKDEQAAIVTVTEDQCSNGQFWTRQYATEKGFPQIIHSSKQFSGPTGLEEYVGFGISMTLRLEIDDDALLFKSDRYILRLFGRRIPLPKWLCPGELTVGHADHGDGWFEFFLKVEHKYLGCLIYQSAMFCDERS
ncbi:MAG: DUF4166 domain-containing protein [Alphaproteobacteria bacterium]